MKRNYFLDTVVPSEFSLGQIEASNGTPKNQIASPSYSAGYDCPAILAETILPYVVQTAAAGYDDAVSGNPYGASLFISPAMSSNEPSMAALLRDIPEVYGEGHDAPGASSSLGPVGAPAADDTKTSSYSTAGAIGGGIAGLLAGALIGFGVIGRLSFAAAGAVVGGIYFAPKAPGG